MIFKRLLRTGSKFNLDPNYKFKCGVEIHTQLKSKYKLFSLSKTSFNAEPNSNVSYFDCGLPGSQPKLNPEALYLALKTAVAMNSDIQLNSTFERKHYFYPDQPLGYQITQHYHPIAKNGYLELSGRYDNIPEDSKIINIEQIQIEQDTGKTNYDKFGQTIKVDLNRSNTPLIELVTKPDFENLEQVRAFVKKYQTIVRHLDICSGDLETGAIRVDVNISINGNPRVEIKNLGSHSEIQDALKFEYQRQKTALENRHSIVQETRGWNGKETLSLRSKEDAVDYRYVPDSELPIIRLSAGIAEEISSQLPELPQTILERLCGKTYGLELKYARFLVENKEILAYYNEIFDNIVVENKKPVKLANNWLFHELMGAFSKLDQKFDVELFPPRKLSALILKVTDNKISQTSAKILLSQVIQNPEDVQLSIDELIEQYDLGNPEDMSELELDEAVGEICQEIIETNMDVVEKIKNGQKNSMKYLIGLAMRETQGKVKASEFAKKFNNLLK
ncbi:amidotransferase subunit B, mitochondrial [Suhomyces tanzawaensis NRRL Y-17324]|uniref:Glutamyl-tRNA(Gln) amidotransferase subunit B, mitochondrial n=1 Tax=Suhomyces tanzawaensis NRRL Y-17324 TaxID=984487 RepID=A0A1E4SPK2_9ASCO|nr:amidotransferase subunit B, mitochondrial [Suhomyces tanzawaensis NRRL Y-17324]ODV81425.1 amidotransferase subunit B, mitochondrial [Suhomyces tanzawaensis NRRL Y-17324]